MSGPKSTTATARNGTTSSSLSQNNVSQVPRASRNSIDRFTGAPASEGPYYVGARTEERSTHLTGLSNQVNAMDDILKSRS
ncbi:hypothetical protein N7478_003550 [Penicillium angulare]|uniref:uncharacterized protein n=1 Tax=Penicillium angulare TaxID=116970 RepID=UPI00253FE35E|nr:uncharacterized protein N7478_003550 [Penicillium angulare]KAJ5287864.1 hypothetical protein N7478_003550 [Penicillium angulare]